MAKNNIHKNFDACQCESAEPRRFQVSPSIAICIFNLSISVKIMKIDRKFISAVVGEVTKFIAATVLQGESSKDFRYCMTKVWFYLCMGILNVVAHDLGPG